MIWPSALTIGGTTLDLADVLADVTIRHGREDVYSDPTPSTCQVVILGATHAQVKAFQVGAPLVLSTLDSAAPELVANPGAETNVAGWFANTGPIVRDTTRAHSGNASFKQVANASGTMGVRNSAAVPTPKVGVPYTYGVWVYGAGGFVGRAFTIQLTYNDFSVAGGGSATYTLLAGWNRYTVTGTFTDTSKMSVCYHRFTVACTSGDTLWWDDATWKEAPAPRFTGTVTDGGLDVDNLAVIAVGKLASLGDYKIGTSGVWPVETWTARVTRAFTEAGLASLLELQPDPAFNPQLAARDSATAGATTLRDYLSFLGPMVGAAIADRPDGKILVQAMGARTIAAATALAPADIAYAPTWEIVMPAGNIVTVRYTGDQSQSVTVTDAASVTQYGPQPATIDTTYVNAADATTRANLRLARSAYAHWNMSAAPVLRGLTLAIGTPVQLSAMPAAAPFDPWTPILEGWTDTITAGDPAGLGTWTMELGLSDPLASGLLLPWNAVPATAPYNWNTINPATAWRDALTLDSLTA